MQRALARVAVAVLTRRSSCFCSIQRKVLLVAAGLAVLSLVVTFLGLHPVVPRVLTAGAGAFCVCIRAFCVCILFRSASQRCMNAGQNRCASGVGMGAGCS